MERRVRLITGLVLFAYAASHFLGHITGVFGVAVMESVGRGIILAPWRTLPGRTALFTSLVIHGLLGLHALYKRRTLRMPPLEAWQLGLGLSIPFFLTSHILSVRVGASFFGLEDNYPHVLYHIWVAAARMFNDLALLGLVWTHGCLGLNFWLKTYATYRRTRDYFFAVAVAIPFLAALGIVNAGWDITTKAQVNPEIAVAHGPAAPGTMRAVSEHTLDQWTAAYQRLYLVLVALTFAARLARDRFERGPRGVRVTYPDGRVVVASQGFSILETSRWAGVPHVSACGGRGRCSTCRVQIIAGADNAPEPSEAERETLERIKAPPDVRLACQLRPVTDISVAPLLAAVDIANRPGVLLRETRELLVTALFIDLRDSTRLAAGRLPFDALYIVDRYVQRVSDAIEANGGVVTTVAGDGVMSIFGAESDPPAGARDALKAIGAIWDAMDSLSREFAGELDQRLAFGAGVHTAMAAVTRTNVLGKSTVQFLGDAGNIAARLEAATKVLNCVCVVSEAVFKVARAAIPNALSREELNVRGIEGRKLPVFLARNREDADFGDARIEAPTTFL
jgi:adenylate cyclase